VRGLGRGGRARHHTTAIKVGLRTAVLPLAAALVIGAGTSVAQASQPVIDLAPSIAAGIAQPDTRVGPFGIRNLTGQPYSLRVIPVLLGQTLDGSVVAKTDSSSLSLASSLIMPSLHTAAFPAGASFAVSGDVPKLPSQSSLYGGLLFQSTPVNKRGQIVTVLSLNGKVLLDPPLPLRRVQFTAQGARAQQVGPNRLKAVVPITNRGNYFVNATGAVDVRDSGGRLLFTGRLSPIKVLPGATVELTSPITARLGPGNYSLSARLQAADSHFGVTRPIQLFGVNQVATKNARIDAFPAPKAYKGETADLSVSYTDIGNVPFTPRVQFEVRSATPNGPGPLIKTIPGGTTKINPRSRGTAHASYAVPASGQPFLITARVLAGNQQLDSRDVSVTPATAPSAWKQVKDFVTEHAFLLVVLLAGLLVLGAVATRLYIVRLKKAADNSEGH
jgi:hypothetical protein